jgi:hypothetical protein
MADDFRDNPKHPHFLEDLRDSISPFDALGYHFKTGHTLSVQNRPTRLAEDVIVLPCRSARLQG